MRHHAHLTVELEVPLPQAFAFIADATNLPVWTEAFHSVHDGGAILRTPNGTVPIELAVHQSETSGTIDWQMRFPDGSQAWAYSRLTPLSPGLVVYSFILTPPPGPLEALEGALEEQAKTLGRELATLQQRLNSGG